MKWNTEIFGLYRNQSCARC